MIFQESIWHTLTETKILKVFELGIQPSHKLHKEIPNFWLEKPLKYFRNQFFRDISEISVKIMIKRGIKF